MCSLVVSKSKTNRVRPKPANHEPHLLTGSLMIHTNTKPRSKGNDTGLIIRFIRLTQEWSISSKLVIFSLNSPKGLLKEKPFNLLTEMPAGIK